jgi:hypothetical protein
MKLALKNCDRTPLSVDPKKRDIFDRLAQHLTMLADYVEQAKFRHPTGIDRVSRFADPADVFASGVLHGLEALLSLSKFPRRTARTGK